MKIDIFGHIGLYLDYEYVTIDKENFYIAKGRIYELTVSKGKIQISNVEGSNFPDSIIVPRKYVDGIIINGTYYIVEKSNEMIKHWFKSFTTNMYQVQIKYD